MPGNVIFLEQSILDVLKNSKICVHVYFCTPAESRDFNEQSLPTLWMIFSTRKLWT